jgi:hypothetical protein
MRLALFIAVGVAAISLAYSMGPDFARYMKIRSM